MHEAGRVDDEAGPSVAVRLQRRHLALTTALPFVATNGIPGAYAQIATGLPDGSSGAG
jgi:hypothetical protein